MCRFEYNEFRKGEQGDRKVVKLANTDILD